MKRCFINDKNKFDLTLTQKNEGKISKVPIVSVLIASFKHDNNYIESEGSMLW
jgi:hypothetical protein